MVSHRIPVLVWSDRAGIHTATATDAPRPASAVGETSDQAMARLRSYLEKLYKDLDPVPFLIRDPEILPFRVDLRAQYVADERVYASPEPIALRVYVVHGHRSTGEMCAAVPILGISFAYHERRELKELVTHYVRNALRNAPPDRLIAHLEPVAVELRELLLRPKRTVSKREERDLCNLEAIAAPLSSLKMGRRQRAWCREGSVQQVRELLEQDRGSILLQGPRGVGKTTVLIEAARAVALRQREQRDSRSEPDEPSLDEFGEMSGEQALDAGKGLYVSSGQRCIAGAPYLGQWEQRVEEAIEELAWIRGALCFDSLLGLVNAAGTDPAMSVAAFLQPFIENRELRVIIEATPEEVDACRHLLPGFVDSLELVYISPLDGSRTGEIIRRTCDAGSQSSGVTFEPDIVPVTQRLFRRFLPYAAMPGRVVDFCGTAFRAAERGSKPLDVDFVLDQFTTETGLPEFLLRDEITINRAEVMEALQARVIGQDSACAVVADTVLTLKAGMNDPGKPIGVYLFSGPTGVGKTELAKSLAGYLFEDHDVDRRLVRLDMSEYSGPGSADRLLLNGDGGTSAFVEEVRRTPFCVVLFDEIEKAAPEIFDMLLALLDEGRLTDRFGRLTTFQSAIVIMTSNLGASDGESVGFDPKTADGFADAVRRFFRPEFFNRLDAVVDFRALDADDVAAIAALELGRLGEREGLARAGLTLQWTDELLAVLAERGYDPRFGARPLQRSIEDLVVSALARFLVEDRPPEGATVRLDWDYELEHLVPCRLRS